jgi:hypothetical protein
MIKKRKAASWLSTEILPVKELWPQRDDVLDALFRRPSRCHLIFNTFHHSFPVQFFFRASPKRKLDHHPKNSQQSLHLLDQKTFARTSTHQLSHPTPPTKIKIMDDSWQETAFTTRHMHNRQSRNGNSKGSSGKSKRTTFDVRKTFGSYTIKCPSWFKLHNEMETENKDAVLELYRLTECGRGVVGEMSLPGVMRAAVLLAASRKSLQGILDVLKPVKEVEEDKTEEKKDDEDSGEDSDEEEEEEEESEEEPEPDRFDTFEKNSFREPKFWLRWNGVLESPAVGEEKAESGLGYIIFPSNDCRKFKGTLNCASLEWKDVAISGHKIAPRSESDVPVAWGPDEVPM